MTPATDTSGTGWFRPRVLFVGLAMAVGFVGCLGLAYVLLNPAPPTPRGPVPGAFAPLSTVAHTYIEAVKHQDCAMTRALTTSNTTAWCDDPRLISYKLLGRTGADGECMSYMIRITPNGDGSVDAGTEPWWLCFRQTKAGRRLCDQGQG